MARQLRRYVGEFSATGLTSNPTVFDEAVATGGAYGAGIVANISVGTPAVETMVEVALEDLRRAADILRPVCVAQVARTARRSAAGYT